MTGSSTEQPKPPLRVAIVGAGLMGRWHADAARHAGARVVAVVDRDGSRAAALAARWPGCRPAANLGAALDGVQVVHVCTPSATHASVARQALEVGCHVLVEKPVAPTAPEVGALVDLARQRGVLLCPVHQFPFQLGVQKALALLPGLGPLRHVAYTVCSAGADAGTGRDADDVAFEILAHPLSLLARLLPDVDVASLDWSVRHPSTGEIRALAQAGDVTTSLLISMSGRPTTNRLEIVGSGGTVTLDLFHAFMVREGGQVSRGAKVSRPFVLAASTVMAATANLARRASRREFAYPGLRPLIARFYAAVGGTGANPIGAAETLAVAQACDRLRELAS